MLDCSIAIRGATAAEAPELIARHYPSPPAPPQPEGLAAVRHEPDRSWWRLLSTTAMGTGGRDGRDGTDEL